MDTGATTIGFDFDDTNSKTIGPYRLVRQIGEGGMGVVYHAQQLEPIRRDVALKVIKPGMDTKQVIARFENERQALAVMDHPNIAHVFDAGATSNGRPYFVMELVDGIPITEYCDSKRLSITERIELLISVCEAIHHAHQKGIIHRDIKPSNILIVEYEEKRAPKVIDFGIAKALGQQLDAATMMTNIGVAMGTPDYMSPEQADLTRHDVDTRSDVYSLGAVLYELLTGTTPLKRQSLQNTGYVDVLERIRTEEPERPSTRSRLPQSSAEIASLRRCDPAKLPKVLQGDLDWIAMKALEKDRARRYESVNGLKRDLERYLRGDAVEAGPPSRTYRLSKFVRRHRAWLAAGATFVALLVSAVVVSSWLAIRASRAEQFALTESATAKAVNEFLRHDVLAQASANVQAAPGAKPDPELTVRTALDRAASRIAGKFDAQPMVEASIRQTISNAYRDLGLYSEAQQHSERALELLRRVHGQTHPLVLTAMKELTELYTLRGQYPEAERLYSQVPELHRKLQGAEHPETLDSLETLASLYVSQGKLSQAESLFSTVLEVRRRVLGQE
ncbi:MAG TPA: serine/threonine-protein kinase, partial [Povalibacter sp.]